MPGAHATRAAMLSRLSDSIVAASMCASSSSVAPAARHHSGPYEGLAPTLRQCRSQHAACHGRSAGPASHASAVTGRAQPAHRRQRRWPLPRCGGRPSAAARATYVPRNRQAGAGARHTGQWCGASSRRARSPAAATASPPAQARPSPTRSAAAAAAAGCRRARSSRTHRTPARPRPRPRTRVHCPQGLAQRGCQRCCQALSDSGRAAMRRACPYASPPPASSSSAVPRARHQITRADGAYSSTTSTEKPSAALGAAEWRRWRDAEGGS